MQRFPRFLTLSLLAVSQLAWAAPPPHNAAMNTSPKAKRAAPAEVAPLHRGTTTYTATYGRPQASSPAGGMVVATHEGKELWRTQVYADALDPRLETDVQAVHITRLEAAAPDELRITDERGRRWRLNVLTRAVTPE